MIDGHRRYGRLWPLLARWIILNWAGWAVGLAAGMGLTLPASRVPGVNEDRALVYIVMLTLGVANGVAQSLVMAAWLPKPTHWIAATVAGHIFSLAALTAINLIGVAGSGLWDTLLLCIFGALIGCSQWWILRRHFHSAGVWIAANAAGFLGFAWMYEHPTHSPAVFIVAGALIGTLASALTGLALAWLLRRPRPAA